MAYVAVKGGAESIEASLLLHRRNRLSADSAWSALRDQVMAEASLWDETVADVALRQAEGSPEEAVFLMRAFRSTLPRWAVTRTVEPGELELERRISAAFKDIPGGQLLGASPDYSHRLIDFSLADETASDRLEALKTLDRALQEAAASQAPSDSQVPKVVNYLRSLDLLPTPAHDDTPPDDVTKASLTFPSTRSQRLQVLARGQTGAVTALGYAAIRGYGVLHPTVAELRVGLMPLAVPDPWDPEDSENDHFLGEIRVTEVESLVPVERVGPDDTLDLSFDLGYGLCFGRNETKAIAMSILDQLLTAGEHGGPLGDEEFVLLHIDSVEATGFISHLKMPHYVTFQSKLESVRATRSRETP